jgi:hypothetical protein
MGCLKGRRSEQFWLDFIPMFVRPMAIAENKSSIRNFNMRITASRSQSPINQVPRSYKEGTKMYAICNKIRNCPEIFKPLTNCLYKT